MADDHRALVATLKLTRNTKQINQIKKLHDQHDMAFHCAFDVQDKSYFSKYTQVLNTNSGQIFVSQP